MAGPAETITVQNLTFSHRSALAPSLIDITLHIPKGSRTVLVGANGGGHSHV